MTTVATSAPVAVTASTPLAPFLGTEGNYMLPHHAQEIERLNRQHRFMNTTTDGKLLVVPVINQQKSLRVLDSGAADGMNHYYAKGNLIANSTFRCLAS